MTPQLHIEAGKFYRTRDGRKARIYATDGQDENPVHGAILTDGQWGYTGWCHSGIWLEKLIHHNDLIAPWIDTPVVDWSKMAAWHTHITKGIGGQWLAWNAEPISTTRGWFSRNLGFCSTPAWTEIPPAYCPQWTGDWRESLIERPSQSA